ncbi:MAG: putative conjugal transfer protein [Elusimicrobia bacterium ADurb.Bin231]|nr:MAG: putative conjugal transfer protein [Elusimicrobia bacterium ADurb.Bin231]
MSGKVIAVMGAKGGVGQTLIAINLAVALKTQTKKKVLLLDFNFSMAGEISMLLNMPQTKSLLDILPFVEKLSPQMVKGYVIEHASGVDYLSAVSDPSDAGKIQPTQAEKVVLFFSNTYDYVILNIGKSFTDVQIAIMDNVDMTILVTTPELASLYHTRKVWQNFITNHFPTQLLKIVLNKSEVPGGLSIEQVTEYLKQKPAWTVPFDSESAVLSINKGVPAVMASSRSPFAKGIGTIVDTIVEETLSAERGTGFFAGLKSTMDQVRKEHSFLRKEKAETAAPAKQQTVAAMTLPTEELKLRIYEKLVGEMKEKRINLSVSDTKTKMEETRQLVQETIEKILDSEGEQISARVDRVRLVMEVLDQALGLGPLEDFLRDPTITEVMVNGRNKIYVERSGKLYLTNKKFTTDQELLSVIERIVTPLGRRIDESSPLVDARLVDGSRVNAVIPPLSLVGPCLTIRKFSKERLKFKDLIKFGSITQEMVEFLRIAVQLRKNILISGGTGSGKTTLLNIVSCFIPAGERILTIEDAAELQLPQEHWVRLESRPPNIEGAGEITIRRLVINALRMRPDRIVVGECRGGEALDMLQAMNTGHDGSMTTVHSNTPRDCLARLETLVLMSGMELPTSAIKAQIAAAIHIIVQIARFSDGTRKITHITEITGMERDTITLSDLFVYKQTGVDSNGKVVGGFSATGLIPSFVNDIKTHGLTFDMAVFQKTSM